MYLEKKGVFLKFRNILCGKNDLVNILYPKSCEVDYKQNIFLKIEFTNTPYINKKKSVSADHDDFADTDFYHCLCITYGKMPLSLYTTKILERATI